MTRDGNVAQLIVKKRESKKQDYSTQSPLNEFQDFQSLESAPIQNQRAGYPAWIPLSSMYYPSNIVRLERIAVVRNASDYSPVVSNLGNVIDSDR